MSHRSEPALEAALKTTLEASEQPGSARLEKSGDI